MEIEMAWEEWVNRLQLIPGIMERGGVREAFEAGFKAGR